VTVNPDSTVQLLAEEAHPLERFDKEVSRVISSQLIMELDNHGEDTGH